MLGTRNLTWRSCSLSLVLGMSCNLVLCLPWSRGCSRSGHCCCRGQIGFGNKSPKFISFCFGLLQASNRAFRRCTSRWACRCMPWKLLKLATGTSLSLEGPQFQKSQKIGVSWLPKQRALTLCWRSSGSLSFCWASTLLRSLSAATTRSRSSV